MSFLKQLLMSSFLAAVFTLVFLIVTSPCPKSEDQNYCQTDQECFRDEYCLYLTIHHVLGTPKPYRIFHIFLVIIAVIYNYGTDIRNLLHLFMSLINYVGNRGQGNLNVIFKACYLSSLYVCMANTILV